MGRGSRQSCWKRRGSMILIFMILAVTKIFDEVYACNLVCR